MEKLRVTGSFTKIAIALSLSLAAGLGCGKKDGDKKAEGEDKPKTDKELLVSFIDKACECKDQACMDAVEKEAKAALSDEKVKKLMDEDKDGIAKEMARLMECMKNVSGGAPTGTEPPAAEVEEAPTEGDATEEAETETDDGDAPAEGEAAEGETADAEAAKEGE